MWLGLLTVSVFALLPRAPNAAGLQRRSFPSVRLTQLPTTLSFSRCWLCWNFSWSALKILRVLLRAGGLYAAH